MRPMTIVAIVAGVILLAIVVGFFLASTTGGAVSSTFTTVGSPVPNP
jgi:hypothetical protein